MKVHELIELLKDCNEDAYAMVDLGVKSGRSATWTAIPMDVVGVWGWPCLSRWQSNCVYGLLTSDEAAAAAGGEE